MSSLNAKAQGRQTLVINQWSSSWLYALLVHVLVKRHPALQRSSVPLSSPVRSAVKQSATHSAEKIALYKHQSALLEHTFLSFSIYISPHLGLKAVQLVLSRGLVGIDLKGINTACTASLASAVAWLQCLVDKRVLLLAVPTFTAPFTISST